MYKYCKKGELIPVEDEGVLVCNEAVNVPFIVESEKPSYDSKRSVFTHTNVLIIREIFAQFQAKETTQIPDQVVEDIKHQIKKERLN